MAADALGRLG